jgi:hypothetical protein
MTVGTLKSFGRHQDEVAMAFIEEPCHSIVSSTQSGENLFNKFVRFGTELMIHLRKLLSFNNKLNEAVIESLPYST